MEEKLDKFLAYLEENGVEISGETAFKCDDGIVLFSPNEGGGVDIAIIRNVIELNYNLGITDADVNLFNTEVLEIVLLVQRIPLILRGRLSALHLR